MTMPTPRPRPLSVRSRLLRGWGPLVGLAVLLLATAVLVPSQVPEATNGVVAGDGSGDVGSGGGTLPDGTPSGAGGEAAGRGSSGAGGGSGGGGGSEPVGTTAGCPDRELQVPGDPYSPACVAFSGGNGGATHRGVSAEEIKVAYRVLNEKGFQQTLAELAGASLSDTPEDVKRTVAALAEYFNRNFQLYGRQIKMEFYDGNGSNTNELLGKGRDKAKADALHVANTIGAFADVSATSEPYSGSLADLGVLAFGDPYLSRKWHEDHAPYAWSLATDGTVVSELAAEYAVKKLHGKPADLAGGALKGQPRRFATVAPENSWYQDSVRNARRITEEAGFDPGLNIRYQLDLGTMSNQASNIIPKLKSEGVTTVFCGCDPILPVFLSGVANRERYYPEFIIVGTALTDTDIVGQLWNQNFARHAFGVSSLMEPVPSTSTIGYAAYKSIRDDEPAFAVDIIYYQMYFLAIGIQGAGPNLNPQTFEQGMFDYPGKLGPAGLWRFGPGDRTAANDVREVYWDPDAVSNYNQELGAYVETRPGERYERGGIPPGDPQIPR